jgi:hypothetical protein
MCKHVCLGTEPRKVLNESKKLTLMDVVYPTEAAVVTCLLCISTLEPAMAILLQKLKLQPPERLQKNVAM